MFKPTLGASTLLDRQSHKRSDAAYLEALLKAPEARFLVLADQKPVIQSNPERTKGNIRWFTLDEMQRVGLPVSDSLFLGVDRTTGGGRFAVAVTEHRARNAPGGLELMRPIVDLRSLAMNGVLPPEELSLLSLAKALAAWHENTRCCGHCGGTTLIKDGGWRRKCWACGQDHFPRTDPVVIMLIVDPPNDRCLLGHEARFAENMWSTLAGFIEPGEDIETAVRRETMEETSIKVGEVRFISTQPWPFPHSLMIGCIGIAESSEIRIDPNEIVDARWFPREEVRQMLEGTHPKGLWVPGQHAIARTLITAFVEGEY
ncbi:MAG: NAD(+) diphosphatase [Proteobacteria bacterium]|jgi:NTP pyrophosphohydrolases containing a Zn-finger, probably nucleic-acid-binding|nr:MAG: NAD(+) diphosphatase [Pseudomonadota bacterium]